LILAFWFWPVASCILHPESVFFLNRLLSATPSRAELSATKVLSKVLDNIVTQPSRKYRKLILKKIQPKLEACEGALSFLELLGFQPTPAGKPTHLCLHTDDLTLVGAAVSELQGMVGQISPRKPTGSFVYFLNVSQPLDSFT
jgi:hypothetical protein